MSTLVAGYWVGEFGWELIRWQSRIRAMAHDHDRVIVGCEDGHQALYQDFATEFIVFSGPIQRRNMWLMDGRTWPIRNNDLGDRFVAPSENFCNRNRSEDWVRYGRDIPAQYDILLHARATKNMNTEHRNYPQGKWETVARKLSAHGMRVASVGSKNGAWCVPGTADQRDIALQDLMDMMRAARVVVGPSSGPMHLASLCGTPHVVWSHEKREVIGKTNRDRYLIDWNPLMTPCEFISDQSPQPSEVVRCVFLFA